MIGVERQGEVEPLAEAIQAIAGQAVDQVKAEGGAGIVQQHHLAPEILTIKRPPDPAGHIRIGALQADLQGAGQFSEQLGLLLVQQFVTHLEVEMDAGRPVADQPQQGLGPLLVGVEGGIQGKHLGRAPRHQIVQLGLKPLQRVAPHLAVTHAVVAELAGVGAAPRELPDHTVTDVVIQQPSQVGRGEYGQIFDLGAGHQLQPTLHQPGRAGQPCQGLVIRKTVQQLPHGQLPFPHDQQVEGRLLQQPGRVGGGLGTASDQQQLRTLLPQAADQGAAISAVPEIDRKTDDIGCHSYDLPADLLQRGAGKILGAGHRKGLLRIRAAIKIGLQESSGQWHGLSRRHGVNGYQMEMHDNPVAQMEYDLKKARTAPGFQGFRQYTDRLLTLWCGPCGRPAVCRDG